MNVDFAAHCQCVLPNMEQYSTSHQEISERAKRIRTGYLMQWRLSEMTRDCLKGMTIDV